MVAQPGLSRTMMRPNGSELRCSHAAGRAVGKRAEARGMQTNGNANRSVAVAATDKQRMESETAEALSSSLFCKSLRSM